jgi:hemerythrin-like domain-containing protein
MTEFPRGASAERTFAQHEHHDLAPGIERLHAVAGAVGSIRSADLSLALLDVMDWVESVLEPHAAWEDAWLYPAIDERTGTPWATKLMAFEHRQIRTIAAQLHADRDVLHKGPSHDGAVELRAHLFGLEALLRAHIEREERFLLPLLEDAARPPVRAEIADQARPGQEVPAG